jgi:hypothetical protein
MFSRRVYACVVVTVLAVTSVAVGIASDSLNIRQRDDCEPASFNAAVGDGTCVGDGETTFPDFFAEFQQTGQVDKWRFNNDHAGIDRGTAITVTNRGGETHTFTRVAAFGGGFVPPLNAVPGSDTPQAPAPECVADPNAPPDQLAPKAPNFTDIDNLNMFIDAGHSAPTPRLTKRGVVRFQCCIHPWMHTEITVK